MRTSSTCEPATDDVQTGRGAWEVAYRFSYIDMLDDLTVKGAGLATDHTFGVNWYLNPYTRLMLNYVHSSDTFNQATEQSHNRRKPGYCRGAVRDRFLTTSRKPSFVARQSTDNSYAAATTAYFNLGDNVMRTFA